jgi:hypothetical protein
MQAFNFIYFIVDCSYISENIISYWSRKESRQNLMKQRRRTLKEISEENIMTGT